MSEKFPNAYSLPAGMVLMPDGEKMTLQEFWRRYETTLCRYPDAQIAVGMPPQDIGEDIRNIMKGSVNALVGYLGTLLFPESVAGKMIGGGIGYAIGNDLGKWMDHQLSVGATVKIVRVRDFIGGECRW